MSSRYRCPELVPAGRLNGDRNTGRWIAGGTEHSGQRGCSPCPVRSSVTVSSAEHDATEKGRLPAGAARRAAHGAIETLGEDLKEVNSYG